MGPKRKIKQHSAEKQKRNFKQVQNPSQNQLLITKFFSKMQIKLKKIKPTPVCQIKGQKQKQKQLKKHQSNIIKTRTQQIKLINQFYRQIFRQINHQQINLICQILRKQNKNLINSQSAKNQQIKSKLIAIDTLKTIQEDNQQQGNQSSLTCFLDFRQFQYQLQKSTNIIPNTTQSHTNQQKPILIQVEPQNITQPVQQQKVYQQEQTNDSQHDNMLQNIKKSILISNSYEIDECQHKTQQVNNQKLNLIKQYLKRIQKNIQQQQKLSQLYKPQKQLINFIKPIQIQQAQQEQIYYFHKNSCQSQDIIDLILNRSSTNNANKQFDIQTNAIYQNNSFRSKNSFQSQNVIKGFLQNLQPSFCLEEHFFSKYQQKYFNATFFRSIHLLEKQKIDYQNKIRQYLK